MNYLKLSFCRSKPVKYQEFHMIQPNSCLASLETILVHRSIESSSWVGFLVVIFKNLSLDFFCGMSVLVEYACSLVLQVQLLKCLMAALMLLASSFLVGLNVALPSAILHVTCSGALAVAIIPWMHPTWSCPSQYIAPFSEPKP